MPGGVMVALIALVAGACGRIGYDGAPADAAGPPADAPRGLSVDRPVALTAAGANDPAAVWTGGELALVWHDSDEINVARFDDAGARLGDEVRLTNDPAVSRDAAIAAGPDGLGIAWTDERSGRDVYFAFVDAAGAPVVTEVRLETSPLLAGPPSIVWTDDRFLVLWHDVDGAMHALPVDRAGLPLGPAQVVSPSGSVPAATPIAGRVDVVWEEADDSLGVGSLAADGVAGPAGVLAAEPPGGRKPAIAAGPAGPVIAYEDAALDEIVAVELRDGEPGDPIRVSDDPRTSLSPKVAVGAAGVGVVWQEGSLGAFAVWFALVRDGQVTDRVLLATADTDATDPAIVALDDGFLVLWEQTSLGEVILLARVRP